MTSPDPNANASAQSVSDKIDGEINGSPLDYRVVNQLSTWTGNGQLDPPESPNSTTSVLDVITTLGKIFTQQTPDGLNGFDLLVDIRNSLSALTTQTKS